MFVNYYYFIFGQRGTKAHWVNPLKNPKNNYVKVFEKYMFLKAVVEIRFRQRDTKACFCQNINSFCYIVRNIRLEFLVLKLFFIGI